jgi:hypothetical protein
VSEPTAEGYPVTCIENQGRDDGCDATLTVLKIER